jgi:hypothetical protein
MKKTIYKNLGLAAFVAAVMAASPVVISGADGAPVQNTNPATFNDPRGDSGSAPDIANVVVSNDASGTITFRINIAGLIDPSPVEIILAIDSDQNSGTGTSLTGTDYLLAADLSTDKWGVLRWTGSEFVAAVAPSAVASIDAAGMTFAINRSDLGNASGVNFWTRVVDGPEEADGHMDDAPDRGVWNYQLASAAPLKLDVAAFGAPKSARAGQTFTVVMGARRSDTGALVGAEGRVQCRATIAGRRLRLIRSGFIGVTSVSIAGCSWRVPSNGHKKTIRGSITVTYQDASVSKQFAAKVR